MGDILQFIDKFFKKNDFLGLMVLVILLFLAGFAVNVAFFSAPDAPPLAVNPDALKIKKDPVKDNWGTVDFMHYRTDSQRKEEATAVVFNEMLDQVEIDLHISGALPPSEVEADSAKLLSNIYRSVDLVPADVYRVACIKLFNAQDSLKKIYSGKKKDFDKEIRKILDRYYYLGQGEVDPHLDKVPLMEIPKTKRMKRSQGQITSSSSR